MKFSESWLREWVNPSIDSNELQKRLTMAGLEIEAVSPAAVSTSNVVVGAVLSVEKHPDAEKLSVCRVSDGKEEFQVVCGAANVRPGLKVPFAKIGARLGEDFQIKKAKLRGVESFGMLCSAQELGMADTSDGLLELPQSAPAGTDIRAYLQLDDKQIEVNLTPNRGDCLSIAGLARELSVLTLTDVKPVNVTPISAVIADSLKIQLSAPKACPRYLGRVIRNINPDAETPLWMVEKLRRCGIRSIDPVVDVTNFILLELGQPLHAFDLGKLKGGIVVRMAQVGESLQLLDGKELELADDVLVIADHEKAVAMAGIMGGKQTAVGPRTTEIFLESAFFEPTAIAGRARRFGLVTDAGHRYERGVDYNLPSAAIERATELLLSIVGGQPGPVVVAEGDLPGQCIVELRRERILRMLGIEIQAPEIVDILCRLGLKVVAEDEKGWRFLVPSWRHDISLEIDLIEELARVKGYAAMPVSVPAIAAPLHAKSESSLSLRQLRHRLTSLGYQEVVTYSFVDPELEKVLGEPVDLVKLANPISQDMAVMRTNLWSGLVKTLKHNQNRQVTRLKLFESGLTFINKNNKIDQNIKVGSILWGGVTEEQWGVNARAVDFYDLKGDVESILSLGSQSEQFEFVADQHAALQPGQTARISKGDLTVGWMGALHPSIQQGLDIPGKVYLMELDLMAIQPSKLPVASELSRFPAVRRDLAVVVKRSISAACVIRCLREAAGSNLIDLVLFDVYQGQNIENDKKSLALGLTFQHASRTLADSEINPIIDNCIKALEAKFNAELR